MLQPPFAEGPLYALGRGQWAEGGHHQGGGWEKTAVSFYGTQTAGAETDK